MNSPFSYQHFSGALHFHIDPTSPRSIENAIMRGGIFRHYRGMGWYITMPGYLGEFQQLFVPDDVAKEVNL